MDKHDRIIQEAQYFMTHDTTTRDTAKEFHMSKSNVHRDLRYQLPKHADTTLTQAVSEKLTDNKVNSWKYRK